MALNDFKGAAKPLDEYDIPELAYRINVSEDHLQAFLNVESRSRGFDRAGRPVMLFEPHVFYRHLSGEARDRAVDEGLAYRKWGEKPYPKDSYDRMNRACQIDQSAALKSASWGSTQVLGENFAMVGYTTVEQMVLRFMDDEQEHVEAMVKYILATGIDDDLRHERWSTVARIYNGPGYAKNGYHTKMAREFAKLRGMPDADWSSDEGDVEFIVPMGDELKTIQRRLGELGYKEVGWADGVWGTKTRAAVLAFRADNDLPLVPGITEDMMAALMLAPKRPIGEERAETSAQDLRKAGSRTIAAADKAAGVGGLVAAGGALGAVTDALDGVQAQLDSLTGLTGLLDDLMQSVAGVSPWLLLAMGAYIVYQQWSVKKSRVEDHRTGKNPYPGGN
jgi:hypothetical protein